MSAHHSATGRAQSGSQFRELKQKLIYELETNAHDHGAFASVHEARFANPTTRMKHGCGKDTRIVAKVLKVKEKELQRAADPRKMVRREVELHQHARHENVARLFDYALANNTSAALWEDFEMATLFIERLDQPLHVYKRERPDVGSYVAAFLEDMTNGLAYIHSKGIIHRDISTRNLMVKLATPENGLERDVFKIIDFGFSRHFLTEDNPISSFGGTKGYMAPEVLLLGKGEVQQPVELYEMVRAHEGHGRDIVSAKVDVYSLGAVLHELLLNTPPSANAGEIPRVHSLAALQQADDHLNPSNMLALIMQSMLQRRPEARPDAKDLKILVAAYNILRRERRAVLRRLGLDPTHPTVRNIQLDHLRASTKAVVERHVDLWQSTRVFDAHDLVNDLKKMLSLEAMKTTSVMDFETLESRTVILYPAEDFADYKVAMLKDRLARQWGEDTDRFCLVLVQRHDWLLGPAAHEHLLDDLFRGEPASNLPSCCFHTGTTVRLVVVRDTSAYDDDGDDDSVGGSEFEVITRPTEIRERDIAVEFASLLSKIKDKTEAWLQILRRVRSLEQQWSDLRRQYEIRRAKGQRKNKELEAIFESHAPLFKQLSSTQVNPHESRMAVLFSLCEQRIKHAHSEHDTKHIEPEMKQELTSVFQRMEREANAWYRKNVPVVPALRALARAEEVWAKYADDESTLLPSSSFINFLEPQSTPSSRLDLLPHARDDALGGEGRSVAQGEQTSEEDGEDDVVLVDKPEQEQKEEREGVQEEEQEQKEEQGQHVVNAEQQQEQEEQAAAKATAGPAEGGVAAADHEQLIERVRELTRNKSTLEYSRKQLKHQLEHATTSLQRLQQEARLHAKEANRAMRDLDDVRREKQAAAERITELRHELEEAQGSHARDASPDSLVTQLKQISIAKRRLQEQKETEVLEYQREVQRMKLELQHLKMRGATAGNGTAASAANNNANDNDDDDEEEEEGEGTVVESV